MIYKGKPVSFYVIYSFDIFGDILSELDSVDVLKPPRPVLEKMDLTEGDDQYEYDWEFGKHRKYAGHLTYEEFEALIDRVELRATEDQTMGSLTEFGWLPAISFDCAYQSHLDCNCLGNAYVTPVCEKLSLVDEDWEPLRRQVIDKFS